MPKDKLPVTVGMEIEMVPTGACFPPNARREQSYLVPILPPGWQHMGADGGGLEMSFAGPQISLSEVFAKLDAAQEWMEKAKVTQFRNSGTHIHLGVPEFLKSSGLLPVVPTPNDILLKSFWGYFGTRERAIWQLIPPKRRINSGGGRSDFIFPEGASHDPNDDRHEFICYIQRPDGSLAVVLTEASHLLAHGLPTHGLTTRSDARRYPLLDIHQSILFSPGMGCAARGGTIQIYRKGLPTFEFRMFDGTANCQHLKGYVCLLINMLLRARQIITPEVAARLPNLSSEEQVASVGHLVQPLDFQVENLVKEVQEVDFFGEELAEWLPKVKAANGAPVDFEHGDYLEREKRRYKKAQAVGIGAI